MYNKFLCFTPHPLTSACTVYCKIFPGRIFFFFFFAISLFLTICNAHVYYSIFFSTDFSMQ